MGLADVFGPVQPTDVQAPNSVPVPGLAGALSAMPDISAAPPQTPEEAAQRREGWKGLIDRINGDPALRQAIMVAGFKLMQPGANLGTAGLSGMVAYNAQQQADQQAQRQAAQDQRDNRLADARIGQVEASTEASRQQADLARQEAPLRLAELQAGVDAIPDDKERRRLGLELQRAQIAVEGARQANAPELARLELEKVRAQIAAAQRSYVDRPTDQSRAIEALSNDPAYANMSQAERLAAATREFYSGRQGESTRLTNARKDEEASAFYNYVTQNPDEPAVKMLMLDPANVVRFQRGKELATKAQGAATSTGAQAAAPARRVISASDIRRDLDVQARTSSGKITQGK